MWKVCWKIQMYMTEKVVSWKRWTIKFVFQQWMELWKIGRCQEKVLSSDDGKIQ